MPRLVGIRTDRLLLRVFAPAELLALREGDAQFTAMTQLVPADGLRAFLVSDEVSLAWLERLRTSIEGDPWEHGFGMVEGTGGPIVGTGGFKGPPNPDGVVEIAYAVVPSRQGRGYATEAALALVEFASLDARVSRIRAHTLPAQNASTSVLTKCGFEHVGAVEDPEDGLVWRWERDPDVRARASARPTVTT